MLLQLSQLTLEYETGAEPIFRKLDIVFQPRWTGIVGANGAGKSSLLKLVSGNLAPTSGRIMRRGNVAYCAQDCDMPPENAEDLFASHETAAVRLRERLRVDASQRSRWQILSMGELRRIQLACALYTDPDILCIDEPTNHLDDHAKQLIFAELRRFRGIGLLVSHDREFLDGLCERTLYIAHGNASLYTGGVTDALREIALERELNQRIYLQKKSELHKEKNELQRRRQQAQKAERNNSKSRVDRHDHDGKGRIDLARVSKRGSASANLAGSQSARVERLAAFFEKNGFEKTPEYGLSIPYGTYSNQNHLYLSEPFDIILNQERRLALPELEIRARDRIALTGRNGAGKTVFLSYVTTNLRLDESRVLYLPQELDDALESSLEYRLRGLDRVSLGKVMSVVASLGSSPERVLRSERRSPGEWRKLFFAFGVLRDVQLIVLDEPTNHFDLPSIRCLEEALADCCCALLLTSHDRAFLQRTCTINWHIGDDHRLRIGAMD